MHYVRHFASAKDCIEDDKITIISYDLLIRAVHIFEKHFFGFVILVCYIQQIDNTNAAVLFCKWFTG